MSHPVSEVQKQTLNRSMVRDLLHQTVTNDLGYSWRIDCSSDGTARSLIEMEVELRELADPKYQTIEIASPDRCHRFSTASTIRSATCVGSLLKRQEINLSH
jgi:hypothetical protein